MKMTISEALAIPKGMKFEDYGKLLEEQKKLQNSIRKLSDKIQDEEYSLEVLAEEYGSERYNKHLQIKQKAEIKREKAQAKLKTVKESLNYSF